MKHLSSFLIALISALLVSPLANAQDDADDSVGLEEIIVTAQRREQSAMDVPISITAFSAETIERLNMKGARDYLQMTPNVNFVENDSQGSKNGDISIRGLSDLTSGANERAIQTRTAIGFYVDDFSVAHIASGSANPPLDDIERIEILRGPQGTYFGRNATGGAINVISKKPDENGYARLRGGKGNFGTDELAITANVPLSDNLFARGSVSYLQTDGHVDNLKPGGNDSESESTYARLALRWQPGDWTFDLALQSSQEDLGNAGKVPTGTNPGGFMFGPMRGPASDYATCGLGSAIFFPTNIDKNCNNGLNFTKIDNTLVMLKATYATDRLSFTSITGLLQGEIDQFEDIDDTGADVFNRENKYKSDSFSQEFRLSSAGDWSMGSMPYNWVVGAITYKDEENLRNTIISGADVAPSFVGFLTVPGDHPNENSQNVERSGWAVFVDFSFDLSDRLTLDIGGRYANDEDKQWWRDTWASFDCGTRAVVGGVVGPLQPGCELRPDQSETQVYSDGGGGLYVTGGRFPNALQTDGANSGTDFSPRVALTWALSDQNNVYASVAQGYRAAGVRTSPDSGQLGRQVQVDGLPAGLETRSVYNKEKVTNYEFGWKARLNNGRTSIEAAVFRMDWDDMQVRVGRTLCVLPDGTYVDINSPEAQAAGAACLGPIPDNRVSNAKSARSQGIEFSIQSLIGDNLQFAAAVGFNDAEFTDFQDSTSGDVSGQELPSAPEVTGFASAMYTFDMGEKDSFIELQATYRSAFTTSFGGVVGTTGGDASFPNRTEDATVFNLISGIEWDNQALTLVVNNLFEEDYATTSAGFSGLGANILPHPRTISLSWTMDVDF